MPNREPIGAREPQTAAETANEARIASLEARTSAVEKEAREAADHAESCALDAEKVVGLFSMMAFDEPGHTLDQCSKEIRGRWKWIGDKQAGFDRHLKLSQAVLLALLGSVATVLAQAAGVHLGWIGK